MSLRGLRVLVVDDEASLHALYSRVARLAGAAGVDVADTASAALELMVEHEYACVLLDKNLPDLGGLALAEIIHHSDPRAAIVIVTGYPSTDSAIDAMRVGCFDYVEKPFQVAALVDRVRAAFRAATT